VSPLAVPQLLGRAQRALWLVCGVVLMVGTGYLVGHWRGAIAGKREARHQVVQDSLEHNAHELQAATAHLDSARRKAASAGVASDSARGQYQRARKRVVVVDDATVIDESVQRQLEAPAVVQLVRAADARGIQDSITIQAERGRAAAAEAKVGLLQTRVGLLEEDLAITREEHAPVIGKKTGLVLVAVVVLDAAARLLHH
jgi:hypothetical protein